jgi:hypothetical protein
MLLSDILTSFDVVHFLSYNVRVFAAVICAVIGHTFYLQYEYIKSWWISSFCGIIIHVVFF